MHGAAFAALGLPHHYLAFHVPPQALAGALAGARALGLGGLNLTVPHKRAACALVDAMAGGAERIGAVNTVVFEGPRMVGHNTDGRGFWAGLAELPGGEPERTVVLGSGGAARAVVDALLHEATNPGQVVWISRRPQALGPGPWRAVGWDGMASAVAGADLLVNATTVGMSGGPVRFPENVPVSQLAVGGRVIDLVYPRPAQGLLDEAAAHGLATQDGLPMLLWQGVRALEHWLAMSLGASVVDAMRAAIGAAAPP